MRHSINLWFVLMLGAGMIGGSAAARDHAQTDRSQKAAPEGNPGSWFTDDDYPVDAKRAGAQGRVQIEVSIDRNGKPTGCRIVASSGSASLDARTCELAIARGTFVPQRDVTGIAVPARYTIATRWVLAPNAPAVLDGPWRSAGELRIDRKGIVTDCVERDSGPVAPWMHGPCPALSGTMPPAVALRFRGGPNATEPVVTLESSLSFDGDPAPMMAFEANGSTVLSAFVAHFEVDPDGTMKNCFVARVVGTPVRDICAQPPLRFQPSKGPTRGVAFKIAISRRDSV